MDVLIGLRRQRLPLLRGSTLTLRAKRGMREVRKLVQ
jgi:hypothetical protein